MLTIYGSYIRFQFSLVSALTYFHEIDLKWPPGNIPLSENPSPPPHTHAKSFKILKMTSQQNGRSLLRTNKRPALKLFG